MNAQTQNMPHQSQQSVGLLNLESFELSQRIAKMLSSSTLVPEQYRATIKVKAGKDNFGNMVYRDEPNPNGLSNCVIALNMSNRMGADPLMVMQNLYLIEGRPAWSSQFIMAAINSCGRFSALRFELIDLGEKEVEYTTTEWLDRKKSTIVKKVKIQDMSCVAFAIERETGERIESSKITIEMAVKEGWYGKNGSKWQTMPEQMLRYRAASFFGRVYAPELLMGLRSADEEQDRIIDVTPEKDVSEQVDTNQLKREILGAKSPATLDEAENKVLMLSDEAKREELLKLISAQAKKFQPAADVQESKKPEPQPEPPTEKKPTSAELKRSFCKALTEAKSEREVAAIESQIMACDTLNKTDRKYLDNYVPQFYQDFAAKNDDEVQAEPRNFDETELLVTQFKEQIEAGQTPEALTKIRATFSANGTLSDEQHEELNTALNQKMATLTKPKTVDPAQSQKCLDYLKSMVTAANDVSSLERNAAKLIQDYISESKLIIEHANTAKQFYAERKTFLENQVDMFENSFFETAIESIKQATSEHQVFDVTMSPDFSELSHEERSTLNSIANQKLNEIKQG